MSRLSLVNMSSGDSYAMVLEKDNTRLRARVSELEGMNQMLLNVIKKLQSEKSVTSSKRKSSKKKTSVQCVTQPTALAPSKKQIKIDMLTKQIQNMD